MLKTFDNNHATSELDELTMSSTGATYWHEDADDQGMNTHDLECNEYTCAMTNIHHVQLLLQRHGCVPLALTMT